MAELNSITTATMQAAIRAKIYSGQLREQLEPELIAMNYVDVINGFADGESWEDVEIGGATVSDYVEGEEIDFKGLEIGTRTFTINQYVNSGHFVTAKFAQDSYLAAQIMAKVPALEARAIAADSEQKIFAMANDQKLKDKAHISIAITHLDETKGKLILKNGFKSASSLKREMNLNKLYFSFGDSRISINCR